MREEVVRDILVKTGNVVVVMAVGLLIGGLIMNAYGYNALHAYYSLLKHSIGNPFVDVYPLTSTLSFATPLIFTGLAFAVSVRSGLFNIGVENAVYLGALGMILASGVIRDDTFLVLVVGCLLGLGLSISFSLVAASLKVFRGVHEVITTIMLNWVAFWFVEYVRVNVFPDPIDPSKTVVVPPSARIPILIKYTELSTAFIIALLASFVTYFVLWRTVIGYELRAVGISLVAARYAGMKTSHLMIFSFLFSAVLGGLAGVCEITGRPPHYAITTAASNLVGLGFDGIAVSLIGLNHPIAVVPAAILVGALNAGVRGMQIEAGVPFELVRLVQGVIVVSLAVPGALSTIQKYLSIMRGRKEVVS
ncbi:MAG: ABC transporter permease [Desulfurococcaceae archaeon TW002]